MKDFFAEFLKLLADGVLIICFAFASFLLIVNIYHYKEITYAVPTTLNDNVDYKNYKLTLQQVDNKMKSVKYSSSSPAKPIFQYYDSCAKAISEGAFDKFGAKSSLKTMDIYTANEEMIKIYNNKCLFFISNNISNVTKNAKSFDNTKKLVDEKSKIIIDNADYLRRAQLANSSYNYTTDNTRRGIFNKTDNEIKLTINNYKLMASLLNDIANWYVLEYGGNN